ncbi:MAG: hypothetical protein GYB21_07220 [Oceanospirillales bacterium]|nr:hypothetical protein [Oceanospirillales bacterium]
MSHGIIIAEALDAVFSTFKKSPVKTSISIIGLIIVLILSLTQQLRDKRDLAEYRKLKDSNYTDQIAQLNKIERDVRSLLIFISKQKESIEENKLALYKLNLEREKATELLSMDKDKIELLFLEQETRAKEYRRNEWAIGILIGVVGSLIASLIWTSFQNYRNKNL